MSFNLPELPYPQDELEPHISAKTLSFHYGKHHKTYVDKLNLLIKGSEHENKSLEDIIMSTSGPIFNNAAQVWNHSFYWQCLRAGQDNNQPTTKIAELLTKTFGSIQKFIELFTDKAINNFGSSWTWLVLNKNNDLEIINTSNAGNPMTDGMKPLLTCDLWEHAYYLDYQNLRPKYIEAFWKLVNWDFVETNL
jgi:Fe-Mn family superoxide dismutase